MKKVAFHNLGCKVNSYEMDGIMQNFQKEGYEIVDFAQKADIYIVNTCTVTNIADRKSRQMLHRAKAENPDALVVATGCYVQTDTEGAVKDEAIDLIVGNNEKAKLFEYVEEYLKERKKRGSGDKNAGESSPNPVERTCDGLIADELNRNVKTLEGKTVDDLDKSSDYENFCIEGTLEHTRAYIKIQDGCNQFCTYCAIPLARGRVRSRKIDDILEEVNKLATNNYRELVLTGIHLSSYGLTDAYNAFASGDVANNLLLDTIEAVAGVEGIKRIRLGSLEPRLITEDFLKRLSKTDKVCPHFHLSLQSGCDSVLKRMNRQYTAKEFKEKVLLLRKYYEHPAITTDIIVGFPQETEEEFAVTRDFANDIDLYEAHVFKYSRRRGTAADKMTGQIPDKEKTGRSSILIADAQNRKERFIQYYEGKELTILTEDIETVNGRRCRVGYSPEYVKCAVDERIPENSFVTVKGIKCEEGILFCECME